MIAKAKGFPIRDEYKSQLERDFAANLRGRQLAGELVEVQYESVRLKLGTSGDKKRARDLFWTPDFLVLYADMRLAFYEVKGSWQAKNQRDARTRIRVAAKQFPFLRFVGVTRIDGFWRYEEF